MFRPCLIPLFIPTQTNITNWAKNMGKRFVFLDSKFRSKLQTCFIKKKRIKEDTITIDVHSQNSKASIPNASPFAARSVVLPEPEPSRSSGPQRAARCRGGVGGHGDSRRYVPSLASVVLGAKPWAAAAVPVLSLVQTLALATNEPSKGASWQ
jgi:hypothetical protein